MVMWYSNHSSLPLSMLLVTIMIGNFAYQYRQKRVNRSVPEDVPCIAAANPQTVKLKYSY